MTFLEENRLDIKPSSEFHESSEAITQIYFQSHKLLISSSHEHRINWWRPEKLHARAYKNIHYILEVNKKGKKSS